MTTAQPTVNLSFRIRPDAVERLRAWAEERGMTLTQAVHVALDRLSTEPVNADGAAERRARNFEQLGRPDLAAQTRKGRGQ